MSSIKTIVFFLTVWLIFGSISCTSSSKSQYINKEQFSEILQEMMVIRFLKINEREKAILTTDVLKKYHVTKKEFEATKTHYAEEPEFWQDVFNKIKKRLDKAIVGKPKSRKTTLPNIK